MFVPTFFDITLSICHVFKCLKFSREVMMVLRMATTKSGLVSEKVKCHLFLLFKPMGVKLCGH